MAAGRAVKNPTGKRVALNMKSTQEVRSMLEAAASASGRSLTAEVEHRLSMSFLWERAFVEKDEMLAGLKARIATIESDARKVAASRQRQGLVEPEGNDLEATIHRAVLRALRDARQESEAGANSEKPDYGT